MAVRIRIEIEAGKKKVQTVGLVNTGFETDEPEILLPRKLAEKMGLFPPASGSMLQEYEVVGGHVLVIKGSGQIGVRILAADRQTAFVGAFPVISETEREVLISDSLASELKISIEDPKRGLWRLSDDLTRSLRNSEKPEYWS